MSKRPTCRYCGAKIAKRMSTSYIRTHADAERGVGGHVDITVDELPITREAAQRLVNWTITRVDRRLPGQHHVGGICAVHGWDGESYDARWRHFCTVKCAAAHGARCADNGL